MAMSNSGSTQGRDDATAAAASLSAEPIPEMEAWRDLVVRAEGPFVPPEAVSVAGGSTEAVNPSGLVREGGEATILTTSGRQSATLIIDLGRVAMGYIQVGIEAASGAPLRVSYSQFREFLRPDGDGMAAPFGTDAHPWSRVDIFPPSSTPQVLESPGKRETRYIAITLDGPGTVTIDFVRQRQTIYPVRYDGYFLSNDDLLNRAWYASAYTGDLATVSEESSLPGAPAGASPWMLTVTFDRVLFMGDLHMQALAGYYQSSDYRWLMRNTLQQFAAVQNSDGSFPSASSHLVTSKLDDPDPADGWNWPADGPDPDRAVGFVGSLSIIRDIRIDSFTAFWVASLADYYLYTGDDSFVRTQLPTARRAVAFLNERTTEDGLFHEPEDQRLNPDSDVPMVANWSPGDTATGVDAFSNAAYHEALEGLAFLERDIAQQRSAADDLTDQAEDVRRALIDHLWDEDAGAMILNDQDPHRDHTGDANAGNLMFRTLDRERARSAMEFLDTLATPYGTTASEHPDNPYRASNIQGYINAQEALGRVRYGDADGALDLIRRWWGHMLGNGPGTGWFLANNDGSVRRGYFANSSWTTALPALSEGILGVRPTAPGYRRWVVAPQLSGLRWAQGRVPVPGGGISVRWKRTADDGLILTVSPPKPGTGEVAVPLLGRQRTIAMDGWIVWRDGQPVEGADAQQSGDAVVFSNVRGEHTFAWI